MSSGLPDKDGISEEHVDDIDQDRSHRLDPENRPENTEVDNTGRTFDPEVGEFTDEQDYDPDEKRFDSDLDGG
ncbi:MAG: hypothetical protein ACRDPH_14500 [Marmoricola sp.]